MAIITNMAKSPAAIALDKFVQMIMAQTDQLSPIHERQNQDLPEWMRSFLYVHKGRLHFGNKRDFGILVLVLLVG